MQFPVKRVHFNKFIFDICESVYEPAEDSFLFAENLHVEKNARVLDVGTGSGILGVIAAENSKEVVAVDLNPFAVRCAKNNSAFNNLLGKMSFIQTDLLTSLSEKGTFDLILFNAPYLPSEPQETETWIGRSWAGGADGRVVIDRFIPQASAHLKPGGRILLMQSSLSNAEKTILEFKRCGLKANVKTERKLPFFEMLTLIEAQI